MLRPVRLAALEAGLPEAIQLLAMVEGNMLFFLGRFDEAIAIARWPAHGCARSVWRSAMA